MKKTLQTLACLLLCIGVLYLPACGGKPEKQAKSVTVKPKTTAIKGDLGEYFEVVERDYQIKKDKMFTIISVEVKRTEKDFSFPTEKINPFGTNGSEDYHVGFGIEIFGENEPEFIRNANSNGFSGVYSRDDVKGLIKLKKGETAFIRWSVEGEKLEKLKNFQITSSLEKTVPIASNNNKNSATSSEEKSEAAEDNASGSAEWDSALASYEEYTDKYIELLKKSKTGDASALLEYASFMQKAQETQGKLQKAQGQLSPTQLARFTQIQMKLVSAAQELK